MSDQSKDYLKKLVDTNNKYYIAIGYQKLTVAGSVVSLTIPVGTTYAEIRFESSITTEAVRYRIDGGLPTSTDGMLLMALDVFDITGPENLRNFKAIQVAAGTHILHITYYK